MKNFLFIFILSCIVLTTAAQEYPDIAVRKGNLTISKHKISPAWILSDATSRLGLADRTRSGYNYTHTYDRYGIVLFESQQNSTGSGLMNEFQVHFIPESNEVAPQGSFNGRVKIDKLQARRQLSKAELFQKLSRWHQSESYMEHSYRLDNGNVYIYFQFTDDELSLKKISIGPQKN